MFDEVLIEVRRRSPLFEVFGYFVVLSFPSYFYVADSKRTLWFLPPIFTRSFQVITGVHKIALLHEIALPPNF
jgi:hypothetical protein